MASEAVAKRARIIESERGILVEGDRRLLIPWSAVEFIEYGDDATTVYTRFARVTIDHGSGRVETRSEPVWVLADGCGG